MDFTLPPLAPTRRRLITVCAQIQESTELPRFYAEVAHMGRVEEWIHDSTWVATEPPTPDLLSELETTLVAPLEAAVMTRWGIQAVLL